jgi:ribosomal protein L3 glutamine methyltransferase
LKNIPNRQYDVIISNPPYVSNAEMSALPSEFLHEPDLALRAEDDGLALAFSLMKQAHNHLRDHGILIIEVGNSAQAMHDRYPDWPVTWLDFERGGDGVFLITKPQLDMILTSIR